MTAKWVQRPDILSHIVDAYAGLDTIPGSSKKRRVFIWEDGAELKMGNCEAFAAHLEKKFGLLRASTSDIHALLRDLGEIVQAHKPHGPRTKTDTGYAAPEADEWVIGRVDLPKEAPPIEPE